MTAKRYSIHAFSAVALVSLVLALPATEARGEPLQVVVDETAFETAGAAAACSLGTGSFIGTYYGWTLPDDWVQVATLIRPSDCAGCPEPALIQLQSLTFRMRWFEACSRDVEVLIVGTNGDLACPAPDTTNVLCAPVTHTISAPGVATVIHTLPFPTDCCVDRDAFVLVRFRELDGCSEPNGPFISASGGACTPCTQYFSTNVAHPTLTELCDWTDNPLWMSMDADCCDPVQTSESTWGRLKALYR